MMYKQVVIAFCILFSNFALAETAHREHGAHQHGVAQLTIALSQHEIELELHSPAYNILGFEHAPSTEQQQQLVVKQFAALNQPADLLNWNTACQLESTAIESPFKVKTHHDEHEEAKHKHHDEHEEAEHEHHDKHEEAEYEHHDEHKETHSDIAVVYNYHCQSMPTLLDIKGLLTHFPNFETLNVQWVSDTQQSASVLNTGKTQVQFK